VRLLAEGAARAGHEVTLAGPPDATIRAGWLARGGAYVDLPIVGTVPAPRADAATLDALHPLPPSFDVVHAHGQKAGILARLAALRAGVPAVYTPHGFVYRVQALRPRVSARARYRVSLGLERALGHAGAAIVTVSEEERAAALADRLAPSGRIHAIHNGVAPDLDAPPDPRLAGERPLFGVVTGLRDQKGLPTLLDALALLGDNAPRFAIVGDGPLAAEIERRRTPNTLLVPFDGRVEPALAAMDAFVLPSYWEGLPLSVLEAMAFGLPVIATAVGGTPEAVRDGITGYLVPAHDATALAARIADLAADAAARERMGEAGRARQREHFTAERMVRDTLALYASVTTV
jgi:glycosyltransferase involved in cell wall biosynthesis